MLRASRGADGGGDGGKFGEAKPSCSLIDSDVRGAGGKQSCSERASRRKWGEPEHGGLGELSPGEGLPLFGVAASPPERWASRIPLIAAWSCPQLVEGG